MLPNTVRRASWICLNSPQAKDLILCVFHSTKFLGELLLPATISCESTILRSYPTGLGALIARRGALNILNKRYFGGGTVLAAIPLKNLTVLREEVRLPTNHNICIRC